MTSIYIKHTESETTHKCGEKSIKARKSTKESSCNRGTWEGVIWCDARKEGETVCVKKTYTLGWKERGEGKKGIFVVKIGRCTNIHTPHMYYTHTGGPYRQSHYAVHGQTAPKLGESHEKEGD